MRSVVYVEGGGDTKALRTACRRGFSNFFNKAGLKGGMPKISACGSRQNAYEDFCHALDAVENEKFIALLVDSEGPVVKGASPWAHLKKRDNWKKPARASKDGVHLMVQCMEAWFLADKDTLADFFGAGFNKKALPARPDIEDIPKSDLEMSLKKATRQCGQKGAYHKGRHSFAILAALNPEKVTAVSPHAKQLVRTLLGKASSQQN